jgi:light-regulated signal transduction histidine kinase (bacteriophytochrome)
MKVPEEEQPDYTQRVQRPGEVQGFGAVLLVSEPEPQQHPPSTEPRIAEEASQPTNYGGLYCSSILAASANVGEILGIDVGSLIDTDVFNPATSPFQDETSESLCRALRSSDLSVQAPLVGSLRHVPRQAFLVLHRTEEGVIIDVEPIINDVSTVLQGSLQTYTLAKSAVHRLQQLANTSASRLCQATAEEVQKLTGYDRVMVYRFHPDFHGEVVAEVAARRAPGSFLGLHFPSSDVPPANRAVFTAVRSRIIVDVKQPAVKVVNSSRLHQNVQLSGSQMRAVTACHARYLLNMGVLGTLVIPILTASPAAALPSQWSASTGRHPSNRSTGAPPPRSPLWGLLVCHHYAGPYRVNYDHRAAVEFVAKVFSLQLSRTLEAEEQAVRQQVLKIQTTVGSLLKVVTEAPAVSLPPCSVSRSDALARALFRDRAASRIMLQLARCDGCAMFLQGTWNVVGECPPSAELDKVLAWLTFGVAEERLLAPGGHWGTISLSKDGYPGAEDIRGTACGLLVVDLLQGRAAKHDVGHGACVMWMRAEMLQEKTWAGNGESLAVRIVAGTDRQQPSESFRAVKEQVEMECRPWTAVEVEGTRAVQLLLQDAIKLCDEGVLTSRILVAVNQERLRHLDQLHRVANELQAVIRTANVPIVKLDVSLRVTELNAVAAELFAERQHGTSAPPQQHLRPTEAGLDDEAANENLPFSAYLEEKSARRMEVKCPFPIFQVLHHHLMLCSNGI